MEKREREMLNVRTMMIMAMPSSTTGNIGSCVQLPPQEQQNRSSQTWFWRFLPASNTHIFLPFSLHRNYSPPLPRASVAGGKCGGKHYVISIISRPSLRRSVGPSLLRLLSLSDICSPEFVFDPIPPQRKTLPRGEMHVLPLSPFLLSYP